MNGKKLRRAVQNAVAVKDRRVPYRHLAAVQTEYPLAAGNFKTAGQHHIRLAPGVAVPRKCVGGIFDVMVIFEIFRDLHAPSEMAEI